MHRAVPHASGHSAPVTMDVAHSSRTSSWSLREEHFRADLISMHSGVLQMMRNLLPRAPSRRRRRAAHPSDGMEAGAARRCGIVRMCTSTYGVSPRPCTQRTQGSSGERAIPCVPRAQEAGRRMRGYRGDERCRGDERLHIGGVEDGTNSLCAADSRRRRRADRRSDRAGTPFLRPGVTHRQADRHPPIGEFWIDP